MTCGKAAGNRFDRALFRGATRGSHRFGTKINPQHVETQAEGFNPEAVQMLLDGLAEYSLNAPRA